ncbi:sigma-70 family RNA polymerase sigma factor [Geothrix fuzhouensis]|uniref:sigma-70 family RNA polymerase sigma factor n=1 Tax=Geothrix fuzhouensis TaxID=2966451 RepID=UPI002147A70D|nr:sigma-70 family RNA polymerase sigma factor [Geothrix fuzhouensis]
MAEPATAELLPVLVHIKGTDYIWTPEAGLDPAAILTLDAFIWREARKFAATGAKSGLSVEDLVQEGHHGALVAAQRFDPAKGLRFITYAVWWIRSRILDTLRKQVVVHIPRETAATMRQTGSLPPVCSLDLPFLADGTTIGDCMAGDQGADITEAQVSALEARRLLRLLKPRERHILIRRFGLCGHPAENLAVIALSLGLSRERVRQLESQALGRLRKVIAYKG